MIHKLILAKLLTQLSDILDYLLNIDNPYFEGMVTHILSTELHLNKANPTDVEAPCLDLHLSIINGFAASKIYGKLDDFDFDIVILPVVRMSVS